MSEEKLFLIKWQNKEAIGSIDVIDGSWLSNETERPGLEHVTYEAGSSYVSTFDLVPGGGALVFRYGGPNRAANQKRDVFLGDMRIAPSEFASATEIAWRQDDESEFEMLPVIVEPAIASEGAASLRTASARERDRQLSALKKALAMARGEMRCEACGFEGRPEYGEASPRCFQVHHKRPLSEGARATDMSDLALICANCHAAIHGLGAITFDQFADRFNAR